MLVVCFRMPKGKHSPSYFLKKADKFSELCNILLFSKIEDIILSQGK